GAMSSLRHWHETQDELVFVTDGALTLRDDFGDTPLNAGDCATFPAGEANGHHILNLSDAPGHFLVIGTRTDADTGWYSDVDLRVSSRRNEHSYTRADGTPFTPD
ncbi:MAG: cupin domain-containing protein, partial [Rhodobacterales bacterium]